MTVALITKGMIAPKNVITNFGITLLGELISNVICDSCSNLVIKRANQVVLSFLLMSNGTKLTNSQLTAAQNIIFAVKYDNKDSNLDAVIYKDVISSTLTILPDGANTDPNIEVTLTSVDTNIDSLVYFMAIQVNFTSTFFEEANLFFANGICLKNLIITQDVIR